ncbi:acyl-CoA dehydrogenase family protein [Streptomyces silvensis]|uniref:acyl-CoA dehydrogenase family protein n=1 Tax=Streptomyces silvensis TaxID=1765722 RepID=UPI0018E395D2|nr:acyl-CoA dehydrogenase family protein [Streptomyces silvensis]
MAAGPAGRPAPPDELSAAPDEFPGTIRRAFPNNDGVFVLAASAIDDPELRSGIRNLLRKPELRAELERVWATPPDADCPHPERVYRELGERGWLAPHWPRRYGGLAASAYATAVTAEELALHGVPDSVRVNTIDNAGATLLAAGSEEQRQRFCPGMAAGEIVFSVLYTEPHAGSDLGSMATTAEPAGDGWRLAGTKTWNARTAQAHFGVCAARVRGHGDNAYAATGLFVVPLDHPGVRVEPIATVNPERFFTVRLDDVVLPADALVGAPGQGWSLLSEALGMERTGVCFAGRARRWFDQLVAALHARGQLEEAERVHRLGALDAEIRSCRLLAWRAVQGLAEGRLNGAAAAAAKWWTSELAQRVAWLAFDLLGPAVHSDRHFPDLVLAAREAPGLTLAAGTSEIQLTTLATDLLDGGDPWEEPT